MNKVLESVMNFINENTTLLIFICIFLIFVLVGYLIDNAIKTRKMEKKLEREKLLNEKVVVNEDIPTTTTIEKKDEVEIKEEPISIEEKEETEEEIPEVIVEDEPTIRELTVSPKINDLLLKDYSNDEIEEVSLNPVEEQKIEEVEVKKKPSPYKNSKKLSDILNSKKESNNDYINSTADFSKELDRILHKLNEKEYNDDSTLDETTDFTNMF